MTSSEGLPDVGQDDEDTKEDAGGSATEDIRKWNDKDIGESECDDVKSSKERQLLLAEMELLCQEREHRCQTEC